VSLLGPAAIVISFDIEPDSVAEHDRWHSREHMPERLSIPGFRRGTRWRSHSGSPAYLVVYEVAASSVLTSEAYLRRLNNPTPSTTAMMKRYRNMARGLCKVVASVGQGLGGSALFAQVSATQGRDDELRQRLSADVLPWLLTRRGMIAAHLFEATTTAPMTTEQQVRGKDADVGFALLATGYDDDAIAALTDSLLQRLDKTGAASALPRVGAYRIAAVLVHDETHRHLSL
jgi:hypothetical protein